MCITIHVINAANPECCHISNPGPGQEPGQGGLTVLLYESFYDS